MIACHDNPVTSPDDIRPAIEENPRAADDWRDANPRDPDPLWTECVREAFMKADRIGSILDAALAKYEERKINLSRLQAGVILEEK